MSSALRRAVRCTATERFGGQLHCGGSVREILGYQSGAVESSRLVGRDEPGHWREVPEHKGGSPVTVPVLPRGFQEV
jgi:hypothetical protein